RGSKALKRRLNPAALLRIEFTPDGGGELDPAQDRIHVEVFAHRTIGSRFGHLPISNLPEKALELRAESILVRPLHRVPLLEDQIGHRCESADGAGERVLAEDHLLDDMEVASTDEMDGEFLLDSSRISPE